MKVGDIYKTNSFGDLEIIQYINARKVIVRFIDTGYERFAEASNIRNGSVKDKIKPFVYGVGFMGDGKHKEKDKAYSHWRHMLKRCYGKNEREHYRSYDGCSVCDFFINYQNFASWFYDNLPCEDGDYQVDKDIKYKGNKLYSPETCSIVTKSENIIHRNMRNSKGFHLKDPSGVIHYGFSQKEFSEAHGLSRSCVCNLINKKIPIYRGWVLVNVNDLYVV